MPKDIFSVDECQQNRGLVDFVDGRRKRVLPRDDEVGLAANGKQANLLVEAHRSGPVDGEQSQRAITIDCLSRCQRLPAAAWPLAGH